MSEHDADCDIAIIGGGLTGLYCAYLLQKHNKNYTINIYEKMAYLGGRMVTKRHDDFLIEYGPSKIEAGIQSKLMKLVCDLQIETEPFPNPPKIKIPDYAKMYKEETELFQKELEVNKHLPDPLIVIMHGIKCVLMPHIDIAQETQTDKNLNDLKKLVKVNLKFKNKFINKYGIMDLLKQVLSEECLEYVVQDGHSNYSIDQNTNAAEHICLFLDLIHLFKWDFISVREGIHQIITKLHNRVKDHVNICCRNKLEAIEEVKKSCLYKLTFNTGIVTFSKHVIITAPPEHIVNIQGIPRKISNMIKVNLKRVKLFKIFVIIENPPWAEGTMELMSDVPSREVQHFVDNDNDEGMLVFYGDEPLRKLWFNSEDHETLSDRETSILLRNKVSEILRASYPNHDKWKIKVIEMNDWYTKQGLGVHLWKPAMNSVAVIRHLSAFSLNPKGEKNVHVCGETFSEYQCFMEGAIRSAEYAVTSITSITGSTNSLKGHDSMEHVFQCIQRPNL